MGTALLVVDVQVGAVERRPYRADEVLGHLSELVDGCRSAGVEVIHVQHDGAPGEIDEPGAPGWSIHPAVAPGPDEKVVRKRYNSAFRDTELRPYLESRGIDTLILVGIQTEYCVDTTCRVACEYGYRVVMPQGTNTTFDNGGLTAREIHDYHNRHIFAGRFATTPSLTDTLHALRSGRTVPLDTRTAGGDP